MGTTDIRTGLDLIVGADLDPCVLVVVTDLDLYVMAVVAEFGDYSEEQCDGHAYLSDVRLLPGQSDDLEIKIMEHHIEHR